MQTTRIYIETDNCSPKASEKCYAYRLECWKDGQVKTHKKDPRFGRITGTYNQVILKILIEAFERYKCPCTVYIHTANQFILSVIKKDLKKWAASQFTKSDGESVANKTEWETLYHSLKKHEVYTVPGGHIYSSLLKEQIEAWKKGKL